MKEVPFFTENLIKLNTEHFKYEVLYVFSQHYQKCTEKFLDKGTEMHVSGMYIKYSSTPLVFMM